MKISYSSRKGDDGIIFRLGDMVETASDFDRQGYGGFTLREAQTIRVRDGLKRAFLRGFLFERLTSKSSGYFCDQFWENAHEHGYRLETFPIGYDEVVE
jgi:hypothetical protein